MNKTKLRIHTWPEKILRKKCRKVEFVDGKIGDLLSEMLCLMRVNDGLGLAANQAGLDLSLIVVETQGKIFKLVNPRILKKEGSICFSEGCLSFPALELEIKRGNRVWVAAQNEQGEDLKIEAEGLLAVVLQHEIDHIQGKVFIDRISLFQKFKNSLKLRKIAKETENELRK